MPPCGPVSSRQRISRSISGASTGASAGWSSSRSMRTTASSRSASARRSRSPAVPVPCGTWPAGASQQQRGDGGRTQHQPHGQRRGLRADVEEVAGDGQVRGDDQAVARPVLVHLVAEQEAFAALGHDDQQRLGQRVVRRGGRRPPSTAAARRSTSPGPGGRARRCSSRISSSRSARAHASTEARDASRATRCQQS